MARITSYEGLGCLVTGASSGIGREIARQLAKAGARVVVTARREDRLAELEMELKELGAADAFAIVADLTHPEAPERIVRQADAHLGHVDVLVNNAGFAVPGPFVRSDLERTARMIEVNVTASVRLARLVLPGMLTRNVGGILTVSSIAGYQAAPYQSTYAGTKAFLLVWSDSLHQEVKHTDVAVTALSPGVTDTEFFEAAGYRGLSRMLKNRMPADKVARVGLAALRKRKMEAVPGFKNRLLLFTQRFVPRAFVAAVSRRVLASRPEPRRT